MKKVILLLLAVLMSSNVFAQEDPFTEIAINTAEANVLLADIEENTTAPLRVVFRDGGCDILLSVQNPVYLTYKRQLSTIDINLENQIGTWTVGVIPGTDQDDAREFLIGVFNSRNGTDFDLSDVPVVGGVPNCGVLNELKLAL